MQSLTATQAKVDQLREALWKATPDQVGAFIQRHTLTGFEAGCIRLTYRAMQIPEDAPKDDIEQLWQTWIEFQHPWLEEGIDDATEREMELHLMADAAIEVACCSV